jgi:hypothetical protein
MKIWREEGIKGMFRGNGVNCVRIMPFVSSLLSTPTLSLLKTRLLQI